MHIDLENKGYAGGYYELLDSKGVFQQGSFQTFLRDIAALLSRRN